MRCVQVLKLVIVLLFDGMDSSGKMALFPLYSRRLMPSGLKDLKVQIHRLSLYLRRWVARSAVPLIKLRILAWNVAFL